MKGTTMPNQDLTSVVAQVETAERMIKSYQTTLRHLTRGTAEQERAQESLYRWQSTADQLYREYGDHLGLYVTKDELIALISLVQPSDDDATADQKDLYNKLCRFRTARK